MDPAAFEASKEKGIAYQLLDAEEIGSVMKQLNAYQRATGSGQSLSAADLYINSKAAFGYNYIDGDLDVTHDHDDQGEHGSHVAGIAAANRYLEQDGAYVDAMEEVQVAGNALKHSKPWLLWRVEKERLPIALQHKPQGGCT